MQCNFYFNTEMYFKGHLLGSLLNNLQEHILCLFPYKQTKNRLDGTYLIGIECQKDHQQHQFVLHGF